MSRRSPARGAESSCVALDLGTSMVRAVEIEWSGAESVRGGGRITRKGSAPLPAGMWNDPALKVDALTAAIRQALSAAGISTRNAVACLPRRLVTLRYLRLPHAPPEELRGMIAFEAQQYLLYSLDDVTLAYQVMIPENGRPASDDMDTVLLAAARRDLISMLMDSFERAGLELSQLSISTLALAELIRESAAPTAIIDLDSGEMEVAVVAEQHLLFTRATALDAQGATRPIIERRLLEEAVRSFTAYQNEFRDRQLVGALLTGDDVAGAGPVSAFEQALSETLDLPVSRFNGTIEPAQDPEQRAYARAIGTALQTRPNSLTPINLVPGERAELRARLARARRNQMFSLVAAAVVLVGIFSFINTLRRNREDQKATIDANQKVADFATRLASLQKQHDQVATLDTELSSGLSRQHPVVDMLVALNAAVPTKPDIWLTQLALTRGGQITIRGETKSALAATDMVLALQKSHAFTDVRLSFLGDAQESDQTSDGSDSSAPPANDSAGTPRQTVSPLPGAAASGGTAPAPRAGGPASMRPSSRGQAATGAHPTSLAGSRSGPVPSVSTPPGGIQPGVPRAVSPAPGPATPAPPANRTRTSFIIDCRINPNTGNLLPVTTASAEQRLASDQQSTGTQERGGRHAKSQ